MSDGVIEDGHGVVRLFQALAHPVRASIIHRLTDRPCSVSELTNWLGLSQPLVSHHLGILRSAHLVEGTKVGRNTQYALVDDHVAHIFLDAYRHTKEHNHDCDH